MTFAPRASQIQLGSHLCVHMCIFMNMFELCVLKNVKKNNEKIKNFKNEKIGKRKKKKRMRKKENECIVE